MKRCLSAMLIFSSFSVSAALPQTPLEPVYHQLFNQRDDLANRQLIDVWPRLNSETHPRNGQPINAFAQRLIKLFTFDPKFAGRFILHPHFGKRFFAISSCPEPWLEQTLLNRSDYSQIWWVRNDKLALIPWPSKPADSVWATIAVVSAENRGSVAVRVEHRFAGPLATMKH